MDYNDSIVKIKGIGEKTQKIFLKIGIETVQDLLEHYPRDYEEFGMPVPISQVSESGLSHHRGISWHHPQTEACAAFADTKRSGEDSSVR